MNRKARKFFKYNCSDSKDSYDADNNSGVYEYNDSNSSISFQYRIDFMIYVENTWTNFPYIFENFSIDGSYFIPYRMNEIYE